MSAAKYAPLASGNSCLGRSGREIGQKRSPCRRHDHGDAGARSGGHSASSGRGRIGRLETNTPAAQGSAPPVCSAVILPVNARRGWGGRAGATDCVGVRGQRSMGLTPARSSGTLSVPEEGEQQRPLVPTPGQPTTHGSYLLRNGGVGRASDAQRLRSDRGRPARSMPACNAIRPGSHLPPAKPGRTAGEQGPSPLPLPSRAGIPSPRCRNRPPARGRPGSTATPPHATAWGDRVAFRTLRQRALRATPRRHHARARSGGSGHGPG